MPDDTSAVALAKEEVGILFQQKLVGEPSNTGKSLDQILKLFYSLNCDVEMAITPRGLTGTKADKKKKILRVSTIQPRSPKKRMETKPQLSH